MHQGKGAEVRLLQLEKAITRNILFGEDIIAKISENGGDVAELEAIIDDLEALLAEVQALDPEADDAVEAFVDIKKEAISLSQEFKKIARPLLSKEDKAELRKKARHVAHERMKKITEKVRNRVRKHNAIQLAKTYEVLGISDEDVIEQLKNGEITIKEVKVAIKEEVQSMSKEEKKETFRELKDAGVKRRKNVKVAVDKARVRAITKHEERLDKRLKASENIKDGARKDKIQERLRKRQDIASKAKERTEKRLDMRKDKIQERKDKIRNNMAGDEE